ncbi:hypothetical protein [Gottfriedia acidiceleris]|uniref:hypothetical protein n=1 Tax=Gottfriedia acidiceleris TaxID=371036 RepID=UPI002FFF6755
MFCGHGTDLLNELVKLKLVKIRGEKVTYRDTNHFMDTFLIPNGYVKRVNRSNREGVLMPTDESIKKGYMLAPKGFNIRFTQLGLEKIIEHLRKIK